jgi:hypothetical protein
MVLLQAAMLGGFMLVAVFCIFLIVGTPLLTGLFMKVYWRVADKKQYIIDNKPYYKEPLPFLVCVLLSVFAIAGFICLLLVLFDKAFPNFYFE